MDAAENDQRLIAVMRRYFAIRTELADLKLALEDARKLSGSSVGDFYHVRGNSEHAGDVVRAASLRRELDILLGLAEGWARGEMIDLGAPGN
ncbi:MAG: hypothetical protein KGI75_09210 [Rhizobiaceae bacterium]|nr:hypothetical protein [Rhizobiaceae bacterium]